MISLDVVSGASFDTRLRSRWSARQASRYRRSLLQAAAAVLLCSLLLALTGCKASESSFLPGTGNPASAVEPEDAASIEDDSSIPPAAELGL